MTLYIRGMIRRDIPQLIRLDHEAFPTEWPPTNFVRELENKLAHYIVAGEKPLTNPELHANTPAKKLNILDRLKQLFAGKSGFGTDEGNDNNQIIVGYAGMWILADEAHVTSIATLKSYQRQGIGEALLIGVIEMAMAKKARVVTLEVRVSNTAAQNLYTKLGFHKEGVRKGYYLDNHEDAVIMTTDYIGDKVFRDRLTSIKTAHAIKWGDIRFDFQ